MILQLEMLILGSTYAYVASVLLNFLIFIPFLIGLVPLLVFLLSFPPFFYIWFINPLTLNIRCTRHTA